MHKLIFLFFLIRSTHLMALENHFLYIQNESGRPFYLSLGNKVYSSSSTGYLILPGLADSSYQFIIGFPKKEWPDYSFQYKVEGHDAGFLLRKQGGNGWALVDLQGSQSIAGNPVAHYHRNSNSSGMATISNDDFSTMLAMVVDDPSIRERPFTSNEEKKPAPAPPVVAAVNQENIPVNEALPQKADQAIAKKVNPSVVVVPAAKSPSKAGNGKAQAKKGASNKNAIAKTPSPDSLTAKDSLKSNPASPLILAAGKKQDSAKAVAMNEPALSLVDSSAMVAKRTAAPAEGIFKTYENTGTNGIDLVYIDKSETGASDTVRIFISRQTEEAQKPQTATAPPLNNNPRFLDMAVFPKPEVKDSASFPVNQKKASNSDLLGKSDSSVKSLPDAVTINPKCKAVASDDDVFRLRKKIIARKDEDEMVILALKEFKTKCYSTDKIRSISYMFLTEKGKYQLLDAAYPYVYDISNFKKLSDLLTEPYYLNRFQALIQ